MAQIAPRADVPNIIEPLGPADDNFRRPAPSTYSSMVHGVAGYVRHLTPGNEPTEAPSAPPRWLEAPATREGAAGEGADSRSVEAASALALPDPDVSDATALPTAPDPDVASAPARLASMRYKVQFTADQTYVDLLEQARDLLEHQIPDRDLAAVQRLAMEALVETLTRRKYGSSDTGARPGPRLSENARAELTAPTPSESPPFESPPFESPLPVTSASSSPSRHDNVMLRCHAHNDLAAEHDFGRLFMERKKRREPPVTTSAPARRGTAP